MTTFTLDDRELTTVLTALRAFRIALTGNPDALDLTREQAKDMGTMIADLMTSETGEPLMLLAPAQIDDLVDRLRSV
jgi:hypothetical protein